MTNGTEPSLPPEITEQSGVISGQKVGYARVSSKDQNLERQIEQLKAEKVFTYYTDKASGGSRERPGLDEAMRYVRAGDQVVVTSMDRCARSLTDLYSIVDELVSKGGVGEVPQRGAGLLEGLHPDRQVNAGAARLGGGV